MPKENVVLFDLLSAEAPRGRTEEILLLGSGNPPPPEGGGGWGIITTIQYGLPHINCLQPTTIGAVRGKN